MSLATSKHRGKHRGYLESFRAVWLETELVVTGMGSVYRDKQMRSNTDA